MDTIIGQVIKKSSRVIRGGNWNNNSNNNNLYSWYRNNKTPGNYNNNIGFRCCNTHNKNWFITLWSYESYTSPDLYLLGARNVQSLQRANMIWKGQIVGNELCPFLPIDWIVYNINHLCETIKMVMKDFYYNYPRLKSWVKRKENNHVYQS